MKYILEISEKQAEIIKGALEEYFRLRMNQWFDFASSVVFSDFKYDKTYKDNSEKFNAFVERRNSSERVFMAAMEIAQPIRQNCGSIPQTDEMLIAQDIWQVIRHKLFLDRGGDLNSWCVDAREPMPMTDEPLPKMERAEDEIQ